MNLIWLCQGGTRREQPILAWVEQRSGQRIASTFAAHLPSLACVEQHSEQIRQAAYAFVILLERVRMLDLCVVC